ncbi:MAG: aldo/keto reductase [Myxococcales bacterium]|nr:aldo/keto reductase [Myxococcales bacterium]
MRYKLLGSSGLRVSELCLGTMTFGEDWGWGRSKDACRRTFDVFVEAGGNFLDTANHYTNGSSEKIVGELIRAPGALAVTQPNEALRRLEEASKVELGFPRDFLVQGRPCVFDDMFPLIDDPERER